MNEAERYLELGELLIGLFVAFSNAFSDKITLECNREIKVKWELIGLYWVICDVVTKKSMFWKVYNHWELRNALHITS